MKRKEQDALDLAKWTHDVQQYQRYVGTELSSDEELVAEWETFDRRRKERELERAATHLVIYETATRDRRS